MENKITVAHLGRRLGSGLMVQWIRQEDSMVIESELTISDYDFLIRRKQAKLILRTDLTKPITHNGETFIPLHKIFDRNIGFVKCVENRKEYILVEGTEEKPIPTYFSKDVCSWEYWMIQRLIEWNFRIDEPKGSYIKAEELPVNPYEI